MRKIENIESCYACGLCAAICKRSVIDISKNHKGFYLPIIILKHALNMDCVSRFVRLLTTVSFAEPIETFAGWSNDDTNK